MNRPLGSDASNPVIHPHQYDTTTWTAIRKAAMHQAMKTTYGNTAYAEDVVSEVLATLIEQDVALPAKAIYNYVRTAVRNRVTDDARRDNAAFRMGGTLYLAPEDLLEREGNGGLAHPTYGDNPADVLIAQQREHALVNAGENLLAMLEERNRNLVRMAIMEQRPHAEIASELGFKNAAVVKQTLYRCVCKLKAQCPEQYRGLVCDGE